MKNTELKKLDDAVAFLRNHSATRKDGQWLDRDGVILASDPFGAVKALRHRMIATAVERSREQGRCFTR